MREISTDLAEIFDVHALSEVRVLTVQAIADESALVELVQHPSNIPNDKRMRGWVPTLHRPNITPHTS